MQLSDKCSNPRNSHATFTELQINVDTVYLLGSTMYNMIVSGDFLSIQQS